MSSMCKGLITLEEAGAFRISQCAREIGTFSAHERYLADMSDNLSVFRLTPSGGTDAYYQERFGITRKVRDSFHIVQAARHETKN